MFNFTVLYILDVNSNWRYLHFTDGKQLEHICFYLCSWIVLLLYLDSVPNGREGLYIIYQRRSTLQPRSWRRLDMVLLALFFILLIFLFFCLHLLFPVMGPIILCHLHRCRGGASKWILCRMVENKTYLAIISRFDTLILEMSLFICVVCEKRSGLLIWDGVDTQDCIVSY